MKNTKLFTNTIFAGLAVLSLGLSFSSVAEARPVLVQRGSHGGHTLANPNNIPLDAKQLKSTSRREHTKETATVKTKQQQSNANRTRKIITRGPNGAAFIVY